ncbi:conserved hypothetical protein, partial [Ricinus communis]
GNSIHDNYYGLWLDASSATLAATPTITNNKIINNNSYGVTLRSYVSNALMPGWTLTNNNISGNGSYNFFFSQSSAFLNPATTKVSAKNNWWGSADPATIAGKIYDYSDYNVLPTLDFSNYLSADGGAAVPGLMLIGTLSGDTTAATGTTTQVLGAVNIPTGMTLTVETGAMLSAVAPISVASGATLVAQPGSTLSFVGSTAGIQTQSGATLTLQGTPTNKILFTSSKATKAKSDWAGITVNTDASAAIENVIVEYANNGVTFSGPTTGALSPLGGTLLNSELRNNSTGVLLAGYVSTTLQGNSIHDNYYGLWLDASSTTLAATPTITNNKIINNNYYGVTLRSYGTNALMPAWTLTSNNISGN